MVYSIDDQKMINWKGLGIEEVVVRSKKYS
jgi:hypothetical protein